MIRFLLAIVVQLLSNALGLLVAAQVLDDMTLTASAFLIAVVIFTVVYAIAQPFFTQMALSYVPALRGGVALVATLVGLLITTWLTDGLSISGATGRLGVTSSRSSRSSGSAPSIDTSHPSAAGAMN